MKNIRRFLPIIFIVFAIPVLMFSSCASLCCNTERSRIEADIAMQTDKKEDVESVQLDAYRRIMWAEQNTLKADFPEQYNDALNAIKSADLAYDNLKYTTSKKLYQTVSSILSDDFQKLSMECRAEKAHADAMIKKALDSGADNVAKDRFKSAQDLYIKAMALKSAGDLPNAVATCKKASAAYEYSAEYACVTQIRAAIEKCDVLKDYTNEFARAESKVFADQSLWNYGTVKDYEQGIILLREAKQYYLIILEQCQKQATAKGQQVFMVSPCEKYKQEGLALQKAEAEAERQAQEALALVKSEADAAFTCAQGRIEWADTEGIKAEYLEIYAEALAEWQIAKTLYERGDYKSVKEHASKVCNVLSDEFKARVAADREKQAQEKAEAERLALERAEQEQAQKAEAERQAQEALALAKREADAAFTCAQGRIEWADTEGIKAEYLEIYAEALAEWQIAKTLYERGDYKSVKEHASKVCNVLSDEFKARVAADREKQAQEKTEAERLALERAEQEQAQKAEAERQAQEALALVKSEADAALTCAQGRIEWADTEGIKAEYLEIYAEALAEWQIAKTLYERGDYKSVKEHASKVCNVLSDEFKARVAADREKQAQEKAEAERLAQEKAQAQQSPIVEQPVYVGPLEVSAVPMPNHFSPDGDGNNDTITFNFSIKGGYTVKQWKFEIFEEAIVDPSSATTAQQKRLFAVRTGIGEPPSTFVWNGKSDKNELVESGVYYPFTFTVTDEKGNIAKAEGKIRADILIVKEGDTIELRIPSFIFRSDTADFLGLNKEIIQMNLDLLEQLAKLFNALPEYSIRIEGHANNVGKMLGYSAARIQTEESKEVLPLSLARAEKIKSLLIEKGVSASRITVAGLGSSKPIVSFTDLANRWKNRRVEFILKKQ